MVEFIDLFPTVLDFAGISAPSNAQGESLVPLLTGKTVSEKLQAATSNIQKTLKHQYAIFRGSAALVLRILDLLWMLDVGCWIFF